MSIYMYSLLGSEIIFKNHLNHFDAEKQREWKSANDKQMRQSPNETSSKIFDL
jgi:hypothetical protein